MQCEMIRYWLATPIVIAFSPFSERMKKALYKRKKRIEMIKYLRKTNDEGREWAHRLIKEANPMFPLELQEKYKDYYKKVVIERDDECGLLYTILYNKKLYFKRSFTELEAQKCIAGITEDQDILSPHHYPYSPEDCKNKVVADFGAAEGFFALSVVDTAKKIYVFEREEGWLEALNKTFEPYKNKVEIVPLFISDFDDEGYVCLDSFFGDKEVDMIKADIEGFEVPMLKGGAETFKKIQNAIICLYHNHDDEKNIINLLDQYGFSYAINESHMLVLLKLHDLRPPYLRHGVLLAKNNR